ncbi:hypothetical protein MHJ25_14130 [Acinetobacter baumannii]|uniref:hypothetical protein n=1 Tax=Acinetobacter baumannii TaxID=470 RepID=UPI001EFEC353|nr:hypothetical protein [Acinetobacter baumannii]MCG9254665.1 hypothetical protein [Acinetobacter baumannii]
MTYHSDTLAFKKVEILKVMQSIDPNFDLGIAKKIETNQIIESNQQFDEVTFKPSYDYTFYLFKKPLLTFHEASCIMTGYDPQYVEQCQNDTNFKQVFSDYLGAKDYIDSCIDAQMLGYDSYSNRLVADDFKNFLANDNTFIDGFNDDLKISASLSVEDNIKFKETISDLEFDLVIEKATVDKLNKENNKLKMELLEKEQKVKELESLSCKKDTDLLSLIFDETKKERYSPDLVLSIKLWEHVYIVNPKDDSHSNKADTWLKANTGYDVDKKAGSASKIREITAPFINWSIHRDKSYTK